MSTVLWTPIRARQAKAIGRIGAMKSAPTSMIMTRQTDGTLTVCPSSIHDRRRWDINRNGKITKRER